MLHLEQGPHRDAEVAVSAVTVIELASGLDVPDAVERGVRTARPRAVLDGFEILPFGVEEAKMYGALASMVRSAGCNPRPRRLDLQIAATAAARMPLLTANPDDFAHLDRLIDVVAVRRST